MGLLVGCRWSLLAVLQREQPWDSSWRLANSLVPMVRASLGALPWAGDNHKKDKPRAFPLLLRHFDKSTGRGLGPEGGNKTRVKSSAGKEQDWRFWFVYKACEAARY